MIHTTHLFWHHKLFQVGPAEPAVPVISDVSSVHDLPKEIAEVGPGDFGVGFQVVVQHVDANGKVASVEGV